MLRRCEHPAEPQYADYGGRGIKVCPAWHDPAVYLAYVDNDLGSCPGPGYSIDRIDNDRDYEPGNIRWATRSEQNTNQRRRPQAGYPVGCSGYKGVRQHINGRWQARIHSGGREISLGYYNNPEAAARAYDEASRRLSGDRAPLNFPGES